MATDVGTQTVSIKFYDRIDSSIVNKRYNDIRQLGIYKGGWLTKSGSNVIVSPVVCEITDGTHQVRVETTTNVTVTSVTTNYYLVLRWTYTGVATADYMELLAVATPAANDLVLGQLTAGGIVYSNATYPRTTPHTMDQFLKVVPDNRGTETYKVFIKKGTTQSPSGLNIIYDQKIELTSYNGKTVMIYVDTYTGIVTASEVAAYNGKLVVAIVVVDAEVITADKITDVRPFLNQDQHKTQFAYGSAAGSDVVDKTVVLPFTPVFVQVWSNTSNSTRFWGTDPNKVDLIPLTKGLDPFNKRYVYPEYDTTMTGNQRSFIVNPATKTITFIKNSEAGSDANNTFYYIAIGGGYNINPS